MQKEEGKLMKTGDDWHLECESDPSSCVADECDGDQSFRDSFYGSGTDWSSLYSVDDYGIPYSNDEEPPLFSHICRGDSGVVKTAGDTYKLSSWQEQTQSMQLSVSGIDSPCSSKVAVKEANLVGRQRRLSKRLQVGGKFVQADLFTFLCPKPSSSQAIDHHELEQTDSSAENRTNKLAAISNFVAKFRRNKPVEALGDSKRQKTSAFNSAISKVRGADLDVGLGQISRACPFYKKIPGTSFTVDAFRYGAIDGCSAYFLSHFHSDHYGGLSKGWSNGPIYCSTVTARLLVLCLSVNARWICPLQLEVMQVIEGVEVTLLDANHCPGAALIHFRLKNGQKILHTGDFRACKAMQKYPELLGTISTLYLDTTYCNPRYRFPGQNEVINFVVEMVNASLQRNSRTLVVVGAYSIGKEKLYMGIAQALGVKIFVDRRRGNILSSLDWPDLEARLCADAKATMLHVLPIGHLGFEKLKLYLKSFHPRYSTILAFRPTGWTYSEKVGDNLKLLRPNCSGPVTLYGLSPLTHTPANVFKLNADQTKRTASLFQGPQGIR
ncbi:hypothetical protein O6H91_Y011400 [Diphasiastrum complanatum]|nr:hypothetical protein O6H91_Y011400 [Diphasiastrum complanatum]